MRGRAAIHTPQGHRSHALANVTRTLSGPDTKVRDSYVAWAPKDEVYIFQSKAPDLSVLVDNFVKKQEPEQIDARSRPFQLRKSSTREVGLKLRRLAGQETCENPAPHLHRRGHTAH